LNACFYNRAWILFLINPVKVNMKIMRVARLGLLTLLLGPGILSAEVVYINDVLRVGVRPEPNNSVSPVNVVMTGMKLEVLDRSEGFIQIRTEQGVEGWIKEIYASGQRPAQLELADLRQKHQQLVGESSQASETIKAANEANAALQQQLDELKEQNQVMAAELQEIRKNTETDSSLMIFVISGLLMLALFVAGLVIGISWHRQQVTKRLGGLRF
jgi:SH3-like domain-containing protein